MKSKATPLHDDCNIFVIPINGEPWFCGKDAALALGYTNTDEAISRHGGDNVREELLRASQGHVVARFIDLDALLRMAGASYSIVAHYVKKWALEVVVPAFRDDKQRTTGEA